MFIAREGTFPRGQYGKSNQEVKQYVGCCSRSTSVVVKVVPRAPLLLSEFVALSIELNLSKVRARAPAVWACREPFFWNR